MRHRPSFSTALAKLGLLIPICVAGHTLPAIDLSSSPQSEVFWTLDGDAESYCSGRLQEALQHCPKPQVPVRNKRKKDNTAYNKTSATKRAESSQDVHEYADNAPVVCQGSAVYVSEHIPQSTNASVGGVHKATICHSQVHCLSPVPGLAEASRDDEGAGFSGDAKQQSRIVDRQISAQAKDTVTANDPDRMLRQVPELLCKPCKLTPKIAAQLQQACYSQPSNGQEIAHDSAWNELIPSFANEACDRTSQEIAYREANIVAEQDISSPQRHLPHDPQFDRSIPSFAREGNQHIEQSSRNHEWLGVRDEHAIYRSEVAHRPSHNQTIPQFVVVDEDYAYRADTSYVSSCDTTTTTVASHTDVAHRVGFDSEIPHLVNEPCEPSQRMQTTPKVWQLNDPSVASSTDIEHDVHYDRQVPRFANEGSDRSGTQSPQCLAGNNQHGNSALANEANNQRNYHQDIPSFASDGHFNPSVRHASNEPVAVQERRPTFSFDRAHRPSRNEDIPYLIQDSCIASPGNSRDKSTTKPVQDFTLSSDSTHAPTFQQRIPTYAEQGRDNSVTYASADLPLSQTRQGSTRSTSEIAHQPRRNNDVPSFASSSHIDSTHHNANYDVISERDHHTTLIADASHNPYQSDLPVPAWVQESCQMTPGREGMTRQREAVSTITKDRSLAHKPNYDRNVPTFASEIEEGSTTILRSEAIAARLQQGHYEPVAEVSHQPSATADVPAFACTSCYDPNQFAPVLHPNVVQDPQVRAPSFASHQRVDDTSIPRFAQDSCLTSQGSNEQPRSGRTNATMIDEEDPTRLQKQQKEALLANVAFHPLFGAIVPTALYQEPDHHSTATPIATAQDQKHTSRFSDSIPSFAFSENGFDRSETNGPSRGGYNEYVTDTSTIIKPKVQQSAVPLLLDQGQQPQIAGSSLVQGTADSRYASSSTVFSHELVDAWVPEMLNECCQENSTAIPLGHQGSIRGQSATSDEALASSEREAWVPSLLTQSCPDNVNAQPKAQRSVDSSYATANTEIQRFDPIQNWVPELLSEAYEQNIGAQPQYQQGPADSSAVARNTDILQQRIAQNWVPELLSECCEQNVVAQPQYQQGPADSSAVARNTDILQERIAQNWVPELLSECYDKNISAQPRTQQSSANSFVVAGNTDIIHEDLVHKGVPQLLGECCEETASNQLGTHLNAGDSPYATFNYKIERTNTPRNNVPELISGSTDEFFAMRTETPESGSYSEEADAHQIAHAPKLAKYKTAAAEVSSHNQDMACTAQKAAPQNYLSAAHPEIPHLVALLNAAPFQRNRAPLNNPAEIDETPFTAVETQLNDNQELLAESNDGYEAEGEFYALADESIDGSEITFPNQGIDNTEAAALAANLELDDSEGAFQLRLEDLLADIRILQDRQQNEAERETALQLSYSQLFTIPGGLAALEAQPRQDLIGQPTLAQRSHNSSKPTDVWTAIDGQTALTQTTPTPSTRSTTPSASSPWSAFQQPLIQSIETRRTSKASQPTENSWTPLALSSSTPPQPLSSACFTQQAPVQNTTDCTDPLCKEWQAQQLSEEITADTTLDQLQLEKSSSWTAFEIAQIAPSRDVTLNATSNSEPVKAVNSPWSTWEIASSTTTQVVESSFQPSTTSTPSETGNEALTLWNQWLAAPLLDLLPFEPLALNDSDAPTANKSSSDAATRQKPIAPAYLLPLQI